MKTIRCKNIHKLRDGSRKMCNRILAILTDRQVEVLNGDPEGGPVFLCNGCKSEWRWIQVSMENSRYVFRVIDKSKETLDNKNLYFHRIERFEEV
jgi:hypothetical protein